MFTIPAEQVHHGLYLVTVIELEPLYVEKKEGVNYGRTEIHARIKDSIVVDDTVLIETQMSFGTPRIREFPVGTTINVSY